MQKFVRTEDDRNQEFEKVYCGNENLLGLFDEKKITQLNYSLTPKLHKPITQQQNPLINKQRSVAIKPQIKKGISLVKK